ncbi:MAG: GLUG motif-containing protein [Planctomycetota bacterium]|jgi:hypothetical protein
MFWEKHVKLTMKLFVLLAICFFGLPAQAKYGGVTGGPNDPYLIFDANQMNAIGADSNDWDKHFKLMADIDLSSYTGTEFNIIGYYEAYQSPNNIPFTGVFDGSGHTISNFTYTSTGKSDIGLFGYVDDPNAEIRNLGLIDPNVDAGMGNRVGSLVGRLSGGTVTGCYAEGSVSGDERVGGLVGSNGGTITNCHSTGSVLGGSLVGGLVGISGGTITNCYSTGSVSGNNSVGGLVGSGGNITNCYAKGSVSGNIDVGGLVARNWGTITNCYSQAHVSGNRNVGGLVGSNAAGEGPTGTLSNCYSTGSVSGISAVGGLVGVNQRHCEEVRPFLCFYGIISNCYSTGSVTGDDDVGGLVGVSYGRVTFSFWDIETSGQATSAGGTPKTTAEMQTASTFFSWKCASVWTIDEGVDYPRLVWENKPGELITVPSDLYGGGAGEPNDPYLIYTAEQLNTIGLIPCHLDKHFKLMADIDLAGYTGTEFNIIEDFWGVFDGSGHTISNFTYTSPGTSYIGLFDYVTGEIKDLGLIDPDVDAGTGDNVGSLVGRLSGGTVTGCYAEGSSVSGDYSVGGLVGRNSSGTITNCYSTGSVTGDRYVGGLVGYIYHSAITNCYSTGSVSGNRYVGGLVGYNYEGTVYNSFWDIQTSGQTTSTGGTGKTTAEMQTSSTFTDADWDFVGETINGSEYIWRLCVDGTSYPELNWQFLLGDFLCPDRVDFIDYSFFASHWAEDNCGASNDCEGTDLDQLGTVDANDLAIFVGNWLAGRSPGQAGNPNPADGATGVDIAADLSWKPGDRAALHEVYFGSDPCALPLVATQPRGQESYDPPGDLIPSTTYYWCIDEVGTYGTVTGTVWSFTTIPGKAHTPNPADGAVIPGGEYEYPPGSGNWYIYTHLIFDPGPTAVNHTGYFSEDYNDVANRVQDANLGPPPFSYQGWEYVYLVGNPEVPPAKDSLVRGMTYYWCVDEADADGHTFQGDIWEFTIQGFYAFAPSPPNDAMWVDPNVVLSWGEGYGVQKHDIYLGTIWEDVNKADTDDITGIYRGFESNPQYQCADLEYLTTYYWRIDEVNGRLPWCPGTIYKGDVWTFTTESSPPP